MIVESYPELAELDAEQKLILAGELWKSAISPDSDSPERPIEAVQTLKALLAHFEKNPDTGVKWEDLRDAKIAK
ncbi:MAG: hypothetical protein L3J39_05705 [Verrucomicrobiales bacterium]|nr:hypothetical protein [Verrucomicrobiales bacterium]